MDLNLAKQVAIGRYYLRRKNEVGADIAVLSKDLELYAEGYVDAIADLMRDKDKFPAWKSIEQINQQGD